MGRVELQNMERQGGLTVNGSRVWLAGSKDLGWSFGDQEVSRVSFSTGLPNQPRFKPVDQATNCNARSALIQDIVAGRAVFQLPERYMKPGTRRRLESLHPLVWSRSGE